jgi:hypothetical protein
LFSSHLIVVEKDTSFVIKSNTRNNIIITPIKTSQEKNIVALLYQTVSLSAPKKN